MNDRFAEEKFLPMFFKENLYCSKCGLHLKESVNCLQGRGSISSKVLVLSDQPTKADINSGLAYSGAMGASVDKYLAAAGITDYYLSYITKCHDAGTGKKSAGKKGSAKSRKFCYPTTVALIRKMQPSVIIALGTGVVEALANISVNPDVIHGMPLYHREFGLYIIPTYSLTFLASMTSKSNKKADPIYIDWFAADIKKAAEVSNWPKPRISAPIVKTLSSYVDIEKYLTKLLTVEAFAWDIETAERDEVEAPKSQLIEAESVDSDNEGIHTGEDEVVAEACEDHEAVDEDDTTTKKKKKTKKKTRKAHNPRKDLITDISFCCDGKEGVHIKWDDIIELLPLLKQVMASNVGKIGHNIRYDQSFLECVGITVNNVMFDTMLDYHSLTMSYAGGKVSGYYKLKSMAWIHTFFGGYEDVLTEFGGIVGFQTKKKKPSKKKTDEPILTDIEARNKSWFDTYPYANRLIAFQDYLDECNSYVIDIKKNWIKSLNIEPNEYYSGMDSVVTYQIYTKLKYQIAERCQDLHDRILMPLNQVFTKMELVGINLDVPHMLEIRKKNEEKAQLILKDFFDYIGKEININSSQQLQQVVFKDLKIKPKAEFKTDGGGYSLDEKALIEYAKECEPLKKILDYRGLLKVNSTYIDGFMDCIDPVDGRIHPSWLQSSTATGRASAKNPAVQTIPKDDELRAMIIPSPGRKLVITDLGQAELRFMAMVSGDQNMIKAFKSGVDFHTATGCKMMGINVSDYDSDKPEHKAARNKAKVVNFGIIYLKTARTLANDMKITEEEAEAFLENWFATYPMVKKWIDDTRAFMIEYGYVESIFGRRRYMPMARSKNLWTREAAIREGTNMGIQSGANDITGMAMIKLNNYTAVNNVDSRIIMVVHDEIISEPADDVAEHILDKTVEFMTTNVFKIEDRIPLVADAHIDTKYSK